MSRHVRIQMDTCEATLLELGGHTVREDKHGGMFVQTAFNIHNQLEYEFDLPVLLGALVHV